MTKSNLNNEILKLEKYYWKAISENDIDGAVALTSFPCVITGDKGASRVSESEYRKMMKSHDGSEFKGIEIESPQVSQLNDETALITYKIEWQGKHMLDTSTWIKKGNDWLCAFHSEQPLIN